MAPWLPVAILLVLVVLQTVAQFRFWRASQRRYPDRLSGWPHLSEWDGMSSDERRRLWCRINLMFAPTGDHNLERSRWLALSTMVATVIAALALVAWSVVPEG